MTIAQFFRVSGGTTQLRGVVPDIAMPSLIDTRHFGESASDNPLPWSRIGPVEFRSAGSIAALLPTLSLRHEQRAEQDIGFRQFQEAAADLKALRDRKTVSLNEAVRRTERDRIEARIKARAKSAGDDAEEVGDDGLLANERSLSSELAAEKARKAARDVILDETANIMGDMVGLIQTTPEIVRRDNPRKN